MPPIRPGRASGSVIALVAATLLTLTSTGAPSRTVAIAPVATSTIQAVPLRQIGGPGHAGLYGWGMATAGDGSVLIGDYWNYRIARYAPDGTLLGYVVDGANQGTGPGQHQSPYGIAVDPVRGHVIFGDVDSGATVDVYTLDGSFVREWGGKGSGPGRFQYPSHVAVASDGRIYVGDQWDHNVVVHDPDGVELFQFGAQGTGPGQFRQPRGMAFDVSDRLYVVDNYNLRVQVFDASGAFLFAFGGMGDEPGRFSRGRDLRGLAVDRASGAVYVVDAASGFVNKYAADGTFLLRFGGFGAGPGQFVGGGREVTVDHDGNVWVGDMPGWRAQKFAPDGAFLLAVPDPVVAPPEGGFAQPRGVAVDAAGNVFVTDTHNWRVQKFAPDGTFVTAWGVRGGGDGVQFNYQRGIAVDRRDGAVLVADTDNHLIKKFTNDGAHVWSVGGFGTAAGRFRNPHGLAVGADGRIYVADTQNARVQVLAEDGSPLSAFGSLGGADGQFRFPRGITVGADGSIWVSDSIRGVVQHFTADGTFVERFGSWGAGDDQLLRATDVEVDSGYVYVADADADTVKVWRSDGTFEGTFGGTGGALGQLRRPHGMDIGPDGHLYVAEQANERVQELRIDPASADSEPPDATVTAPVPGERLPSAAPVVVSGRATDDVGVGGVDVAIRDASTGLWLRADGTWGAFAWHAASLDEPGSASTAWSFTWAGPPVGSFGLLVRGRDTSNNADPTRPWVPFSVLDGEPDVTPPDATVSSPARNEQVDAGPVAAVGSATDDMGVAAVDVALRDTASGLWLQPDGSWGPFAWHAAVLDAPGAAATGWSFTWADGVAGTYAFQVRARDGTGNADPTKPWVPFSVVEAGGQAAASAPASGAS